jgi:hypothetical protein
VGDRGRWRVHAINPDNSDYAISRAIAVPCDDGDLKHLRTTAHVTRHAALARPAERREIEINAHIRKAYQSAMSAHAPRAAE